MCTGLAFKDLQLKLLTTFEIEFNLAHDDPIVVKLGAILKFVPSLSNGNIVFVQQNP